MNRRIKLALAAVGTTFLAVGPALGASAADFVPSGQRILGQSVVEPVYDGDHAGVVGFISTPEHAPLLSDEHARAPLYLPVYPAGATVGQLICPHVPVDTCPDHGPAIAGLAQSIEPDVYAAGVIGHDHVAQLEGAGTRVSLVPTLVLFTSRAAADEHLVTTDEIDAAVARGDAVVQPLPPAALHAEQVSTRVWQRATPVQ
ncbi:hypothetical protein [Nocardioides taihuensis]|uniref:Uncharacterized protein n=1 Tax=Nocardioides taihuensis TaxID=1835606 RepID=A0ABW0BGS2_9ACTN